MQMAHVHHVALKSSAKPASPTQSVDVSIIVQNTMMVRSAQRAAISKPVHLAMHVSHSTDLINSVSRQVDAPTTSVQELHVLLHKNAVLQQENAKIVAPTANAKATKYVKKVYASKQAHAILHVQAICDVAQQARHANSAASTAIVKEDKNA